MFKTKILLFTMITITSCGLSQNIEKEIKNIRNNFKTVEGAVSMNAYTCSIIQFDWPGRASYGSIAVYKEGDLIRKIVLEETIYETTLNKVSFYLQNNQLFFAYQVINYQCIISESEVELHQFEHRYYFKDEKPIRCLEKEFIYEHSADEVSGKTPNKKVDCHNSNLIKELLGEVFNEISSKT